MAIIKKYSGMHSTLLGYMNTKEPVAIANIPLFINTAQRSAMDDPDFRLSSMRTKVVLTVAEDGSATKPSDYVAAKHLVMTGAIYSNIVLTRVPYESVVTNNKYETGIPRQFSDEGSRLVFYPKPESSSQITLDYYYQPATLGDASNVSVSNFRIKTAGAGYVVGDVLSHTPSGGTEAQLTVTDITEAGAVVSVAITTVGSEFVKGADAVFTGGTGTLFEITIPSVDDETNFLVRHEPNLIIYGAMAEYFGFRKMYDDAEHWEGKFMGEVAAIIRRQEGDEWSGGTLVMKDGSKVSDRSDFLHYPDY